MKYKGVAFDFDGVILDSEIAVIDCWKIVAEEKGIPDIEEYCRSVIGLDIVNSKKKFDERYKGEFSYEDNRLLRKEVFMQRFFEGKIPLKKNVREILMFLKEKDIKVSLATSTYSETIRKEIEFLDIDKYFDELVCGDMVKNGKPHPEIYLTAAKRLGLEPDEVIGVEDSYNGVKSSKTAGLYTVMVPDLLVPTGDIMEFVDVIYEDVREIKNIFV
ncbi:MAG: HAD family phosphatase [Lachnospiraceae bacterium]|nr:HAD family phosphatase [Lachnospiraceae bacterium]